MLTTVWYRCGIIYVNLNNKSNLIHTLGRIETIFYWALSPENRNPASALILSKSLQYYRSTQYMNLPLDCRGFIAGI